jgi:uncharacterized membrane protein
MSLPRLGLIALVLLSYTLVSYAMVTHAPASPWTLALVLGPLAIGAVAMAWQSAVGRGLLGLGAVGLAWGWSQGGLQEVKPEWLYVGQHVGIMAVLCATFGAGLAPGKEALITMMARRVHGGMEPGMAAYTRRLSGAWALLFAALGLGSLALYLGGTYPAWSVWANLVTPVACVGFFVGEHLMRYRWHPEFERITLAVALRAWRDKAAS